MAFLVVLLKPTEIGGQFFIAKNVHCRLAGFQTPEFKYLTFQGCSLQISHRILLMEMDDNEKFDRHLPRSEVVIWR